MGEPPFQSPTMIASLTCVCLEGGRLADAVDVIVADCAWSSIAIASSGCSLLYRDTEAGENHLHIDWISWTERRDDPSCVSSSPKTVVGVGRRVLYFGHDERLDRGEQLSQHVECEGGAHLLNKGRCLHSMFPMQWVGQLQSSQLKSSTGHCSVQGSEGPGMKSGLGTIYLYFLDLA